MADFLGKEHRINFAAFSIDDLLSLVNNGEISLLQLGIMSDSHWTIPRNGKHYQCHFAVELRFSTFDQYLAEPQKNIYLRTKIHSIPQKLPLEELVATYPSSEYLNEFQQYGIMLQYALPRLVEAITESLVSIPGFPHIGQKKLFNSRFREYPSQTIRTSWQWPTDPAWDYLAIETHLQLTDAAAQKIDSRKIYEMFKALPYLSPEKTLLVRYKKLPSRSTSNL